MLFLSQIYYYSLQIFEKIWELVLKWKSLISKIPYTTLILAILVKEQCFFTEETSGEPLSQGS